MIRKVIDLGLEKNILFLDEVSWREIAKYYCVLDLFVAPQRHEGFGLTPSEAMASGIPVVAFKDVGAFNEQIIDKKTGLIVEHKCSDDLADAIKSLISDRKKVSVFFQKMQENMYRKTLILLMKLKKLVQVYKDLFENLITVSLHIKIEFSESVIYNVYYLLMIFL